MRAADFQCPMCGEPPADVAADYEIGPDPEGLTGIRSNTIHAHCAQGHGFFIGWQLVGGREYETPAFHVEAASQ